MRLKSIIALSLLGSLLQGAPTKQWVQQQEQLKKDQENWRQDHEDTVNEAEKAYDTARGRVIDFLKGTELDATNGLVAGVNPIAFAALKFQEFKPVYVDALHGDFGKLKYVLADQLFKGLSQGLPKGVDPTEIQQLFDFGTLKLLTDQVKSQNSRAEQLLIRQAVIDRAQKAQVAKDHENASADNPRLLDKTKKPPANATDDVFAKWKAQELADLEEAEMLNRWFDLGDRGFTNEQERDRFYERHPLLEEYSNIAKYRSPATEAEKDATEGRFANSNPPKIDARQESPSEPSPAKACAQLQAQYDAATAAETAFNRCASACDDLTCLGNCGSFSRLEDAWYKAGQALNHCMEKQIK